MKWYRAFMGRVDEVEIERVTEKYVVIKTSIGVKRELKSTDWYWFRPTKEEAVLEMIKAYENQLEWERLKYEKRVNALKERIKKSRTLLESLL